MTPFLLPGVTLRKVAEICHVADPLAETESWQVSQTEFAMTVEGVGAFYARNGSVVEVALLPEADREWVNIYLNGILLAVVMHQRKTVNFHASSFIYRKMGIMLLGETGAGKSSLTAAFILQGAGFLSDDFTPVRFENGQAMICPVNRKIKLRKNTIRQLGINDTLVTGMEQATGKHFMETGALNGENYPLGIMLKMEIGDVSAPEFTEPDPAEKFSLLRSEVCSWEILAGMPDTEAAYLNQLLAIVTNTKIVRVVRPVDISVPELFRVVEKYLLENAQK